MQHLQYLQYFLVLIGALTICYGLVSSRMNAGLQQKQTFWVKLDNARAKNEVHEYAMYQSSLAISGLIYLSGFVVIGVLSFGISFPDHIFANIQGLESLNALTKAIFGTQLLTAMVLFALPISILGSIFSEKIELTSLGGENKRRNGTTSMYCLSFICSVCGFYLYSTCNKKRK